ncbi:M43 family zinc metalloprotease [Winogradskyella ouciana]|uniref:Peptidase M43 pregnancy-associated plasma-A domain-containing protein n=1 Tax=Winogradskyella ouciana TaxID=2608631 RepID=A0A7K1G9U7_9FLAO|nr:M43 family zinc metalloprotease [Winogradskyella ouciana]MTE26072.1 hypothetical protein [Winogradskyella ouciana]
MKYISFYTILVVFSIFTLVNAQNFQDNVTNEIMGEFPSQWDLVAGMATVDQQDGYKFINFSHGSIIKPIINEQTDNYLSDDFTVEFDMFFGLTSSIYGQRVEIRFWDGIYGYRQDDIVYKPIILKRDGLETSWEHPQPGHAKNYLNELHTLEPVWRHVKIECKTGKLKIYLDEHLVLNIPRFKMQPTMVSIGGKINDSRHDAKVGFTNFSIVSTPKETKIAMIVDRKTNKVLDINTVANLQKLPDLRLIYPNTKTYFGTISGNHEVRPYEFSDVKKPDINIQNTDNQTVRPYEFSDIKKPQFIDINTYGRYTLLPEKEAQMVFNFEKEFITENLRFDSSELYVIKTSGNTLPGNYFETKTSLQTPTKTLTVKDNFLYVLPNQDAEHIGETEKNLETNTNTNINAPSISTNTPVLGNTDPNIQENIISSSQNQNMADDTCGAVPTEAQIQILADSSSLFNKRLKFLENFTVEDLRGLPTVQYIDGQFILPQQVRFSTSPTENYTIIPIAAHILRLSNRQGGLSLEDLYASVNRANELFDKYGVYLHLDKISFIDNDEMFNTSLVFGDDVDEEVEVLNIPNNNIEGKLNIYFVKNTKDVNNKSGWSWSSFPSESIRDQHIIMNNAAGGTVLVHEIGHWFNLLHTHEVDRTSLENINGDNCSTAGDYCCDTPADPGLNSTVVKNCIYTGAATDSSNNSYNPDPTNFMSYAPSLCKNVFSDDQIKRMYTAYLGMEEDRGYRFEVNGGIGQNIQTASLSPGWKAVEHFEIGNKTYMACFNDTTSEIAIHELRKHGQLGSKMDYKDYTSNMSFVGAFRKGLNNYLVLMNYSNGELGIIKLNSNGTLGAAQPYQVGFGWGSAFINANKYLVLFKREAGTATYTLNADGRLGEKIAENQHYYNSSHIVESFGQNMIFYNPNDGYARKASINQTGIFNLMTGDPTFVDNNWTTVTYAPILNNYGQKIPNIIFLDKNSGQIMQYNLTENWKIGENWYNSSKINGNIEPGFDTITPYDVFDGNRYRNYVMISNSTTGKILTYHLNNNL